MQLARCFFVNKSGVKSNAHPIFNRPAFVLQTASTFGLIAAIDHFMETISISWQGAFLFALCAGLINFIARKDEPEPPTADSREFREIEKKFDSKR